MAPGKEGKEDPVEEGGRKGSRESSLALSQKKEMQQLYKPN